MEQIRIVIAEKDRILRRNLKETLAKTGYLVIGEADDGMTALKMVRGMQPDLVLVSRSLPVMSGLELAKIIEEGRLAAVVLMVDYGEKDRFHRQGEKPSIPVLIKPFDEFYLSSILDYAYASYNRMVNLESEVRRLKKGLETRKIVEKAKGILMKTQGLSEDEAFKKMQHQSMNKRMSMKKIAEAIITAHEMSDG